MLRILRQFLYQSLSMESSIWEILTLSCRQHIIKGVLICLIYISRLDDAGTAAIKTVELDAVLGGRAVQHHEIQGHESNKLLSYFKPFIYLQRKTCNPFQAGSFARSSLNHDDVFILDTDEKIYQFNGANSNIQERAKALEVVQYLKDKYHEGTCDVAIVDDGKLDTESDSGAFWVLFGGFVPIGRKVANDDDIVPKLTPHADAKCYGNMDVFNILKARGAKVPKTKRTLMVVVNPREVPEYELNPQELQVRKADGISKGIYQVAKWNGTKVSIKILDKDLYKDPDTINAFKHELTLFEKVRHPNAVQFVGAVTQNVPMMIVSEYHPKALFKARFEQALESHKLNIKKTE
ncbi:Gelsolin-like domain [Arabidopsis suecica]|uniref:Gelsolin-like domain n=1 Tax=Arabidopsis suecica TaxID=45249 RepID=A0A8T2FA51_ARASU|nr:Gelsolin-like domain [Arabidopsis suecica]